MRGRKERGRRGDKSALKKCVGNSKRDGWISGTIWRISAVGEETELEAGGDELVKSRRRGGDVSTRLI